MAASVAEFMEFVEIKASRKNIARIISACRSQSTWGRIRQDRKNKARESCIAKAVFLLLTGIYFPMAWTFLCDVFIFLYGKTW